MRIAFVADDGEFEADEFALVCGVSGGDHWLTFQRVGPDSPDDWGVHLEYADQSNGGYDCVRTCRLTPEVLTVDLSRPLERLAGVIGFDVTLRLPPEKLVAVREGLRRVFREPHAGLLDVL